MDQWKTIKFHWSIVTSLLYIVFILLASSALYRGSYITVPCNRDDNVMANKPHKKTGTKAEINKLTFNNRC